LLIVDLFGCYIFNAAYNIIVDLFCYNAYTLMLGVALGTEYCGAESAAIYDPRFWTFTVGMV